MKDLAIEYPWTLVLLFGVPLLLVMRRRHAKTTEFSNTGILGPDLGPGILKRYGLDALGAVTMVSLVLALANLQYASYWEKTYLESKWIMIVQDLSGSMWRPAGGGAHRTLGDVALAGAEHFIDMRQEGDLIGLIGFSSYAKLIAPPTFDREILKKKLFLMSRESDSIVQRELAVGGATNASYATWLALCVFLALLPEESRLSVEELNMLRYSLLGRTLRRVEVPEKLRRIRFGQGMAIVLFTDGRIEANKTDEDVRKGLPNFVNVVKLVHRLGIKLYLIVVGGDVNQEVRMAMKGRSDGGAVGKIFYMPRTFSTGKIREVYREINAMERNRLLTRIQKRKKQTRRFLTWVAWGALGGYCFLSVTPGVRRL